MGGALLTSGPVAPRTGALIQKKGPPPSAASGAQAPLFENGTAFSGFALGRAATLWRGAGGGARQQSKFVLGNFKTNPKLERDRRVLCRAILGAGLTGTKVQDFNSSESLILAQNERWQRG